MLWWGCCRTQYIGMAYVYGWCAAPHAGIALICAVLIRTEGGGSPGCGPLMPMPTVSDSRSGWKIRASCRGRYRFAGTRSRLRYQRQFVAISSSLTISAPACRYDRWLHRDTWRRGSMAMRLVSLSWKSGEAETRQVVGFSLPLTCLVPVICF